MLPVTISWYLIEVMREFRCADSSGYCLCGKELLEKSLLKIDSFDEMGFNFHSVCEIVILVLSPNCRNNYADLLTGAMREVKSMLNRIVPQIKSVFIRVITLSLAFWLITWPLQQA